MKLFNSAVSVAVTRNLSEIYLDQARAQKKLNNFDVALPLYDQAKDTLMLLVNVKEALRQAQDPQTLTDETLRAMMADAYAERAEVLERLDLHEKAEASRLKAKKWGYVESKHGAEASPPLASGHSAHSSISGWRNFKPSSSPVPASHLSISAAFVSPVPQLRAIANIGSETPLLAPPALQFFKENLSTPMMADALPVAGASPKDLQQLANALILLSLKTGKKEGFEKIELAVEAQDWLSTTEADGPEVKRLYSLATDVIRIFVDDELKELSVAEVVVLAPGLPKELFGALLKRLINGIHQSKLLETDLLDGLTQMIRNAAPEYLDVDDLVKILEVVSERLQKTHAQSEDHLYRLTYALARILDAMADYVKDVDREQLREPLLTYLKGLQSSTNPYLVYQAAYACQALAHVPDGETRFQGAVRRGSSILKGVSGLVSAVKGFDLNQIVESLSNIYEGVGGLEVVYKVNEVYEKVTSLAESGQTFVSCLQEGLTFEKKETWYKALEGADVLLQQRKLSDFEEFVHKVFCRQHKAFQWGLSERLGQLAANPGSDQETRQGALGFLEDLYRNDAQWRTQAFAKKRIIQIIRELSIGSPIAEDAGELLARLANEIDSKKRAFYESCLKDAPTGPYPLYKPALVATSSILLDRVQDKPKVENDIQRLKRERLKEWKKDERLYVKAQGKVSFQATETFDLTNKVNKFLNSTDKKILLLLGDSGAGKSTFNFALEANLWSAYLKDPKNPREGKRIPLLIALPEIDNPTHELVEKHLHLKGFSQKQIRELKNNHEFVFILDSYDESQQSKNLYLSNKINKEGGWKGQVIIGCRSEYFGEDDRARFAPADASQLQEIVVAPFSDQEINLYTEVYAKANPLSWTAERYQDVLKSIANLKELVTNPFLLKITLDVLPRLENQEQNLTTTRLTRVALYDEFVEQWFERGKQRFLKEKTLEGQEKKVFEELIDEGFTASGIAFVKELAVQIYEMQRGNPIVKYARFEDKKTWKQEFFGPEDEKRLLRETWPLSRNKNQYQFIHKSLLEYFVARAVFEPGQSESSVIEGARAQGESQKQARRLSFESDYSLEERAAVGEKDLLDTPLGRKNFVKEPAILGFLVERAQKESLFRKQLHAVIERSKKNDGDRALQMGSETIRKAAANAITILIKAGVQFNGADLKGIQIPGADLSFGVFDLAQLQGADLRKTTLRTSWLHQANLSGAQMAGVQFGEWAYLQEESAVLSCAYSPDEKACAIGLENGTIRVYATSNWEEMHTLTGHTKVVFSVVYSPSGAQIASGSYDKTVRVWDAHSGAAGHTLTGHTSDVRSVVYSPNGAQIASGSRDKTVRLWDVHSGAAGHTLTGHTDAVYSVVYSPSGLQIASGSYDKTVRLWDAHSGAAGHTLTGHTSDVRSVVYSPSGAQIASGSSDETVRLWDAHSGAAGHTLTGHTDYVRSVVYSPSSLQIASGSEDKTVRLWDAHSGAAGHTLTGHTFWVLSVVYSPSGAQIASGSRDKTVRLWDAHSGAAVHTLTGHTSNVDSVVYSPSGAQLASGSSDETVRLWEVASGHCLSVIQAWSAVYSVAWTGLNGHNYLVSGSEDRSVRQWEIKKDPEKGYQALLCWSMPRHNELMVKDTLIEEAHGLSPMNVRLLTQRGATGGALSLKS